MMRLPVCLFAVSAACVCAVVVAGCHVTTDKDSDHKNVDIGTPFGSMHVKTDNSGGVNAGLAAYPGATPVKENDGDNSSADVNMSFGSFHLGVKASSFLTPDAPDKVLAFYRKDMTAKFGTVIECKGHEPVGQPGRTPEGLTCEDKDKSGTHHNGIHWDSGNTHVHSSDGGHELRAGSPQHQHIVGVENHDGGTKIGLVALDLPGGGNDAKESD